MQFILKCGYSVHVNMSSMCWSFTNANVINININSMMSLMLVFVSIVWTTVNTWEMETFCQLDYRHSRMLSTLSVTPRPAAIRKTMWVWSQWPSKCVSSHVSDGKHCMCVITHVYVCFKQQLRGPHHFNTRHRPHTLKAPRYATAGHNLILHRHTSGTRM